MSENRATESIRSKLVVKAVRNIRKAGQKEDAEKGMYRPEIKLDLQRSILLTESYKETEGEPMVLRRAKALVRIENKTYGICRVTGKLIPKERLRSVPHTTQSIEAKMQQYKD